MNLTRINGQHLFPALFNTHPSLAEYRGQRWLTYRHEPLGVPRDSGTRVAICECDEQWEPIAGTNRLVQIPLTEIPGGDKVAEDARLFYHDCSLWLSATNRQSLGIAPIRCGAIEDWKIPEAAFRWIKITDPQPIEKNWPFFEHEGVLYGSRWINGARGHEVCRLKEDGYAEPAFQSGARWDWPWGVIHGGTCPIRYGNLFVGVFHSFTASDQGIKTYYAAPYAFEAQPPFRVVLRPVQPMLWPTVANHHKDYVVFPCGLLRRGEDWICSYGDDLTCWKAEFRTEELFDILRPL